MCVEAAQPPRSSAFGLSIAIWFEALLDALRDAEARWRYERLFRDVRRRLDDRSPANIGLTRIPGPMDATVNVAITLLGAPTYEDGDARPVENEAP